MKRILLSALLSLVFTQTANGNWLGKTCARIFSHIAVDDPYQYEQVRTDALVLYYTQFGIKGAWNKLEERDAITMNIMGAELRWRLGEVMIQFESAKNRELIDDALERYQDYEGVAVMTKDRPSEAKLLPSWH